MDREWRTSPTVGRMIVTMRVYSNIHAKSAAVVIFIIVMMQSLQLKMSKKTGQ
jgi:hypothetical protein